MGILRAYSLRVARKRRQLRAWRKGKELRPVALNLGAIRPDSILLFCTLRNEAERLPYFLDYYRQLGIGHFIFVDNDSTDGSGDFLAAQSDCSVYHTTGSYKASRFGMDWMNSLLTRHGCGHWTLTVDVDEFLVYAHSDTRPLRALTDWLDASSIKSFGAMLIDLYGKEPVEQTICPPGTNPVEVAPWFDSGNYVIRKDRKFGNLWIQGGPRLRMFFAEDPANAPALNKIPLVKWRWGYTYVSSTHSLLPRSLNQVYEEGGGERAVGALLHAKFLATLAEKAAEEAERRQHYANSREYRAYRRVIARSKSLWTEQSERFRDWRQLEELGLISSGGWL